MKNEYDVSIIIPVYNTNFDIFSRCINSVEKLNSKEIIVIDDGSKKEFSEFYKEYCITKNILYYKKKNGGVSSARNFGINVATSEYVMFVDSDDEVYNFSLNLSDMKKYDLIVYNINYIIDCYEVCKKELSFSISGEYTAKDIFIDSILNDNFDSPCAKMYRRNMLVKNNIYFNTDFINGEDALFNLNVLEFSSSIFYNTDIIYKYYFSINHFENRWKYKYDVLLENYKYKFEYKNKLLEKYNLTENKMLRKKMYDSCIKQMFRMCMVDLDFKNYSLKQMDEYIKELKIDSKLLSYKQYFKYMIIHLNLNFLLKVCGMIRKIYLKIKNKR